MEPTQEITANCAVCNGPGDPECPCESTALKTAVSQAEQRWIVCWMATIRQNVTDAAVTAVTSHFHQLRTTRYRAHQQKLHAIPYYTIYLQYAGRPPLNPHLVAQLRRQIMEAEAELKRGIDSDWKTCVMKYPEILDYYFSMVKVSLPGEGSPMGSRLPSDATGDSDTWTSQTSPFNPNFPFEAHRSPSELKRDKSSRRGGMRKERNGSEGYGTISGPGIPLERPPMERPPMDRPATVQPGTTNRSRRASVGHYFSGPGVSGRRPPPPSVLAPPPGAPMPPMGAEGTQLPAWMRGETMYHR